MNDLASGKDNRLSIDKAVKAARIARRKHERFWTRYRKEIVGSWYRGREEGIQRIINYPYLFETTFMPELCARLPEPNVTATLMDTYAIHAQSMRTALVAIARRQKFLEQLRLAVADSFYAAGFIKTGLDSAIDGDAPAPGSFYGDPEWLEPTMPFAERISPFDMLWDDAAQGWDRCAYIGNEFFRDRNLVLADPRYDPAALQGIESADALLDDETPQRRRFEHYEGDLPEFVRLIEFFVRPTRQLYTLIEYAKDCFRIIRKVPYVGPPNGCYHKIGYKDVVDRVMPLAPAAAWFEQYIELEINERKANEQAQAEKRVVTAEEDAAQAAKKFKAARPDDLIVGAKGISEIHTGGVTAERLTYIQRCEALLERSSGVTDLKRGVSKSSETATESSILQSNANVKIADMRRAIARTAQEVYEDWKWYFLYTPSIMVRDTMMMPDGMPAEVEIQGGPEIDPVYGMPIPNQPGPDDYRVDVDPDTLYADTSQIKQAQVVQDLQIAAGTLGPLLAQVGAMLDPIQLTRWVGRNRPSLAELPRFVVPLTPVAMAMQQQGQMQEQGGVAMTNEMKVTEDSTQSSIMNSPETNGLISMGTQTASPMRQSMTMPGANNAETSAGY